jgi:hypothetical protein
VPEEALVILNDEQVGLSPVTVSFQWYGDYDVRISKEGYETLNTHRWLKAPWYDMFPFDFVAQCLNPNLIMDTYEWTFEMEPQQPMDRQTLVNKAISLQEQLALSAD